MGLPTTWAILCLVHLYWLNEAGKAAPLPRGPGRRPPAITSVICGDDALVAGLTPCLNRYEEVLRASGGLLSPGKHFRSSEGRGVFLERLLSFRRAARLPRAVLGRYGDGYLESTGSFKSVEFANVITLRGMVCPFEGLHLGASCAVAPDLQVDLAAGAVVDSLITGGSDPVAVHAVQVTLHRRALQRLRKAGVAPCLPRCLGGAGFITSKGWDAPLRRQAPRKLRRAIAVLLSGNCRDPGPGIFSRQWRRGASSPVNQMAEEDAETLLSRVPHAIQENAPKQLGPGGAPWYLCGQLDDFVEQNTEMARRRMALMMGNDVLPLQKTGPGEVGRRIRNTIDRLIKIWPSASPMKRGTVGDAVARQRALEEASLVWLPGTEDLTRPGFPFGAPWLSGHATRLRLRDASRRAIGLP